MAQTEDVWELPTDGVIGLLPPHESLVDLASYGPILVAQEECERNYEGDVLVVEDEEIQDTCCEIIGVSANLVFPCSNSFRFLNVQLKNLDKYTAIEIEVIDTSKIRRKLQFTNSQSKVRITNGSVSMPLKLTKGWNHLCLDLDQLLKSAFGTGLRKSLCEKLILGSVVLLSLSRPDGDFFSFFLPSFSSFFIFFFLPLLYLLLFDLRQASNCLRPFVCGASIFLLSSILMSSCPCTCERLESK